MTSRSSYVRASWPTLVLPLAVALMAGDLGPPPARDPELGIPEIQGQGHYSRFAGKTVRSSGVVTAVAGPAAFVQAVPGDGSEATSDAIVVLVQSGPAVTAGDSVRFTGIVAESIPGGRRTGNLPVTVVNRAALEVIDQARPLPAPIVIGREGRRPPRGPAISPDELPVDLAVEAEAWANHFNPDVDAIDFFESLEGMRVTIQRPVAVSPTQTFNPQSSELTTLPDGGADIEASRRTAAGGILLQSGPDNRGSQNPERVQVQFDALLFPGAVPAVEVGDRLGDVTGVLRYDFGNYEVAATERFEVHPIHRAPATSGLTGTPDRLTVASYNVLNLSAQPSDDGQRTRLARQIVRQLRAPDILALQEIQDDSGETDDGTTSARGTLGALVDAIASAGGPRYRAFDVAPADGRPGGAPGGNIRTAFLYQPGRVRLLGYASLTADVLAKAGAEPSAAFRNSRDPLLGRFEFHGRRVTVINNHLSSRYGSTPVFGAVQPFVQAGQEERAAQAKALQGYVAHLLVADRSARVIVVGDMNTFEFTNELARILPGSPAMLHDLITRVSPGRRYTYNYEGNSQALDHLFVSRRLLDGAEIEVVHLNVDYPSAPGEVASDHEPILARVRP